ncbi:MAG TPA: galactose oxidase early set domain-containing protein [Solimonas sp.]
MSKKWLALPLLALTLGAAGCGGGGSSEVPGDGGPGPGDGDPFTSSAEIGEPMCAPEACVAQGGFTPPFVEPVIFDRDPTTPAKADLDPEPKAENGLPIRNPLRRVPMDDRCERLPDGRPVNCKPTAASVALLNDGRVLYFNALEGTENVEFSIVTEAGQVVINDQTRVLSMGYRTARWLMPSPFDGGADEEADCLLPGCLGNTDADDPVQNSGALFCSDLDQLPDGRIIAVGGTNYYFEPGIAVPSPVGVVELEGLKSSRVFDPKTNRWSQTGSMNWGRWYPTLVPLENGDLFVGSGVTKLLKPVYPTRLLQSGRNVVETETFDLGCETWADNGALAQRSLPLYPRLHLLPNGHVYYNGGGQSFNPFGQSYDQALWNIVGAYDPASRTWTDLGYAGLPLRLNEIGLQQIVSALNPSNGQIAQSLTSVLTGALGNVVDPTALLGNLAAVLTDNPAAAIQTAIGAGFRGSTFSIMLPLKPDPATGVYGKAEFLVAGGVLGAVTATSPGSYVTVPLSRIDTVDIAADGQMAYSSRLTGAMTGARWYGTSVLLPTGEVMTFSGANRDEVVLPGTGTPILRSEMFDPVSETWKPMATQTQPRTYHNTAMLLPDGRVLVGGHSPINTAYLYSINLPGQSPNDGRDPTFEIYSPPYLFKARPAITAAPATLDHGTRFTVRSAQAQDIESVVLVRNTSLTHIIDGAQRNVELRVLSRSGDSLTVEMPTQKGVLPPGPYMLFVNQRTADGLVPSVSRQITVTGADFGCSA